MGEYPIVRFKTQSSAEAALQALKAGQVFLDGFKLNGEWRGGGGRAVRQRNKDSAAPAFTSRPEEDGGSRMLTDAPGGPRGSSRMLMDAPSGRGRDPFAQRDDRQHHS